MKYKIHSLTMVFFFLSTFLLYAESSPEWGKKGVLSEYGIDIEDLSHKNKEINCDATLKLTIQVPKPIGLYYQVSDFDRKVIYRDNFEYSTPNKNEFWGLIQFPEKGKYIIRIYILDEGFKRFLYYIVNCKSGYKDKLDPVYTGKGIDDFGFSHNNLPSSELLIETDKAVKLSFTNTDYLLRYNVGILDLSHEPKFISTEPNANNLIYYRYPNKDDCNIYLYFKKNGYYIVRIYASEILEHKGGLLAEYVIHAKADTSAEFSKLQATTEVFTDANSVVPKRDWYETEKHSDTAILDDFIKNAPLELREDPYLLTSYFTKRAKTNREKVRAAYVWLQYFIHYDMEMASTANQTSELWVYRSSLMGMLERRYATCNGYARLFGLFCRLMDIETVFITGNLKGSLRGHAWSAVLIDGNWQLLDATSCINAKQIKERNFLPNPYEFIDTHFPADPFWQLLDKPMSKEEARENGFFKEKNAWETN